MKQKIDCPYCDGTAVLQRQPGELTYRKEVFKTIEHFYRCNKCNEEFTTTESDSITLLQVHNQYREKNNIPFPEEIILIREKYGLSATRMSEVLGLGVNGYSNYEKGEMPIPAIANLIKTAAKPEVFIELLQNAREHFTENAYGKATSKVTSLLSERKAPGAFSRSFNVFNEYNNFTGYKSVSAGKIANIVTFFIRNSKAEHNNKLKLNKQLFYADFNHYKNHGQSITGLSYRAINYGPVPSNYDNVFAYLENEEIIRSNWVQLSSGVAVETFESNSEFEAVAFTGPELETIYLVAGKFKNASSWDMVTLSHGEKAWKELEGERKLISYQAYAFYLKGL